MLWHRRQAVFLFFVSINEFFIWGTGGYSLLYNCSLPVTDFFVCLSWPLSAAEEHLSSSFPCHGAQSLSCQLPPREILYSAGWWFPAEPACSGTEVDVCSADPWWLPSSYVGVSVKRRCLSKWVQGMWSRQSGIDPSGYAFCQGGLGLRV